MTTHDRLIALIAHHSAREPASIGPLNTLAGDLDLDSLDRLDLRLAIEDAFGIDMTDEETDRPELGTVGGLLEFVEDRLTAPLELVELAGFVATPDWAKPPIVVNAKPDAIDLREPSGMETLFRLARESDKTAEHHLRAAFDAGVRAGRCDPSPQAAWQAFKASVGL